MCVCVCIERSVWICQSLPVPMSECLLVPVRYFVSEYVYIYGIKCIEAENKDLRNAIERKRNMMI